MIRIGIDGVYRTVPSPTLFEAKLNPQQKTAERNNNGRLLRETLPDKWTLDFEWRFGSPADHYEWFKYLRNLTRLDFEVQFPSPEGEMETSTFYISPISSKMLSYKGGVAGSWETIKCSFVEV